MRNTSETILTFDINQFKNDIVNMYLKDKLSIPSISEIIGVSNTCIRKNLKKWNIRLKNASETQLGFDIIDKKLEIIDMYENKNLSSNQIGEKIGVNAKVILRHLKKWNVSIRDYSECKKGKMTNANNPRAMGVGVYKDDTLIQSFTTVKDCTLWMVEMNISNTCNSAKDAINTSIKKNKQYKGYYFIKENKKI